MNNDLKKTKNLTCDELQAYFDEHVHYEIQHLINTAAGLLWELPVPNGLQCVVVESFAIHLRNLIFFFYPHNPQDTDVCAKDFFIKKDDWDRICPTQSEFLKHARVRANREVGHLTTARKNGTPKNKGWDVKGLTKELIPVIELFLYSADKIKADLPTDLIKMFSHFKSS